MDNTATVQSWCSGCAVTAQLLTALSLTADSFPTHWLPVSSRVVISTDSKLYHVVAFARHREVEVVVPERENVPRQRMQHLPRTNTSR